MRRYIIGGVSAIALTPLFFSASANAGIVVVGGSSPPEEVTVFPARGQAGTSVTLMGLNIDNATSVHFGEINATFSVTSTISITATVPPGSGKVPITITTPDGTSEAIGLGDYFSYEVTPVPTKSPEIAPTISVITTTSTTTTTINNTLSLTPKSPSIRHKHHRYKIKKCKHHHKRVHCVRHKKLNKNAKKK